MSKKNKVIYWIATIWLALGMLSTGLVKLLKLKEQGCTKAPGGAASITHLGYPIYILTLLGSWKILGVITVLIPKYPLIREWAMQVFLYDAGSDIFKYSSG